MWVKKHKTITVDRSVSFPSTINVTKTYQSVCFLGSAFLPIKTNAIRSSKLPPNHNLYRKQKLHTASCRLPISRLHFAFRFDTPQQFCYKSSCSFIGSFLICWYPIFVKTIAHFRNREHGGHSPCSDFPQ